MQGCCGKDQQCCKGGKCCESGNNCVIVQGQLGCCPIGETCGPRTCQDAGYSPCADFDFCCLTGYQCYRDNEGNAKCRDPNPPPPPTSSYTPPESSYVSVPPTTEEEGSTYEPPPQPTVTVVTTQTQVFTTTRVVPTTQTMQPNNPSVNRPTSSGTSSTIQAAGTGAILGSQTTKTSTGAIAGGVAAGVVAIVVLVIILIVWRRRKGNETSTAGASPAVHNAEHHEPGAIPPTPGSGNPFLTPMGQNQNFGVSYFNGVPPPSSPAITAPSGSNSGIGPYNASQYSGLPEPQQNSMGGTGVVMPQPRYDSTHPHPLPMTIVHSQRPQSSDVGNVARPWSAYTPSPGINAAPYAESNNSQPSAWAAQTNNSTSPPPQTGYANPPYADYSGPGRPASTVYQPSSHVAYSPPGSPALPEVYGGMVGASGSGSGSGLPPGAAPPVNVYRSDEKKSYVPYQ
ncbi:hypothetical protein FRC09_003088 [Ceratobasidium sp. 395]|nr:hypothetical protein FRC09_003088 [Ceratobasidium sp. 395]